MQSVRFVFRTICPPLIKAVRTICLPYGLSKANQSVQFVSVRFVRSPYDLSSIRFVCRPRRSTRREINLFNLLFNIQLDIGWSSNFITSICTSSLMDSVDGSRVVSKKGKHVAADSSLYIYNIWYMIYYIGAVLYINLTSHRSRNDHFCNRQTDSCYFR